MSRASSNSLAQSITFAGHALLLAMLGVAIMSGRVVGVAQTPANVAVGVAMIVASGLLILHAFGLVPKGWGHVGWGVFFLAAAEFFVINFL